MSLQFSRESRRSIERHCVVTYPAEACGILVGKMSVNRFVDEAIPCDNAWPTVSEREKRFVIDPLKQLQVERSLEGSGRLIVGFYHSHPDHPAEPSAFDLEVAWPVYDYVIVSVRNQSIADVRCWRLNEVSKRFDEILIDQGT